MEIRFEERQKIKVSQSDFSPPLGGMGGKNNINN